MTGTQPQTVEGIRRLVAKKVNVLATTLIRPENEAEIDRLKQWCLEDLGVAGVRLSTVAPFGRARNATELLLSDHRFRAVYADEKPTAVQLMIASSGTLNSGRQATPNPRARAMARNRGRQADRWPARATREESMGGRGGRCRSRDPFSPTSFQTVRADFRRTADGS